MSIKLKRFEYTNDSKKNATVEIQSNNNLITYFIIKQILLINILLYYIA